LTIYTVTSTGDENSEGTLRWAMAQTYANHNDEMDTIKFAIPGGGIRVITISSKIPRMETPNRITIDGTTQPGYNGSPLIRIDGQGEANHGFEIAADDFAIYGLEILNMEFNGIMLSGDNAIIGAPGKGNVIHGNGTNGIALSGNGTVIEDNKVGCRANGQPNPNGWNGIQIIGMADGIVRSNIVYKSETAGNTSGIRGADGCNNVDVVDNTLNGLGVLIDGQNTEVTIRGNQFNCYGNKNTGIAFRNGANNGVDAPEITAAHYHTIEGTGPANADIDTGRSGPRH